MNISENISLGAHSTMRLGGNARWLAEVTSDEQLQRLVNWGRAQNISYIMIGQGSNIVWRDEGFDGLVLVNKIPGKLIVSEDETTITATLGGGENWDETVAWSVAHGWSGIEFLSLIPGTVGAAPVQNIGAYGAELAQTLKEVGVYDTRSDSFESIPANDCGFSYRSSRFKTVDKGRFMITHIVIRLNKSNPRPPFYEVLQNYMQQNGITEYTPKAVREAVIAIRSAKLPDPALVANNGSFFTNPIIDTRQFMDLQQKYPEIKGWPMGEERVKVAAGWLVEKAGFRGVHDQATGMAIWDKQALVLVNEHARSTADLLAFRQKIINKVNELFGVVLEQEPELLP